MRVLLFFVALIVFNSCKTKVDSSSSDDTVTEIAQMDDSICPEGASCTVEVQKNKSLKLVEDGTGALYPEIVDGENMVVVYTYSKKGPEGTADGDYSETIHFEVPATTSSLSLEGAGLIDVKLLFGKHCFCKGEAGYYLVENGTLKVDKTDAEVSFNLTFKMEHPSHQLNEIVKTASL